MTVTIGINHTGCRITEGIIVFFRCTIYRPCDIRPNVRWYKSASAMDAEEDVVRDNGQYISSMSNKYLILPQNPVINGNFDNCCSTSLVLGILNFNQSDSGYYWCQFVANNSRLLLPSPYGYISLSEGAGSNNHACTEDDLTLQLDPAVCAENTRTHSGRMSCASQTTIYRYSNNSNKH